jgi:hypothetical protein
VTWGDVTGAVTRDLGGRVIVRDVLRLRQVKARPRRRLQQRRSTQQQASSRKQMLLSLHLFIQ